MAEHQTIVENGRVSALFKILSTVIATLVTLGILGIFQSIGKLQDSISQLNTTVALLNSNYENSRDEFTRLRERVTELERIERRDRNDNRD